MLPLLLAAVFAGATAAREEAPAAFRAAPASPSPKAQGAAPTEVRIGLTTDPLQARFFGAGGLLVLHPASLTPLWKPRFDDPVVVILDLPKGVVPRSVFRLQVGSFATEEEADSLKDRLERLIPDPIVVSFNPDRNSYRVRAGQFERREDAGVLTDRLVGEGFSELWVAEEAAPASGKARLRLVDSRYYSQVTEVKSILIRSALPGGTVEVDGQPYRGTMEVRILGDSLKVINQLGIEEYLRGVVPNEMGPGVYPELEALKAQAVAARTYLVANRGQFSDSGYDICDSPACQVYRGFGTEHPLTNQAVEETAGIIAGFNGGPIKALYTSTCGGHTEDAENIFSDLKLPYLKGVDCYPEVAPPSVLVGRDDLPAEEAGDATLGSAEVGWLFVSGVVGPEVFKKKALQEEADPEESLAWWRKAFVLTGAGSVPQGFRFKEGSRLEWGRFIVEAFGWKERANLALDPRDLPYILSARDADQVPSEEADTVAFLLRSGIFTPLPDGTLRIRARPSRAAVLGWIFRIADRFQSIDLRKGHFRALEGGTIRLESKGAGESYPLAAAPCLYHLLRGKSYPDATLLLAVGDPVTYHLNAAGAVDAMLLDASSRGAADDRSSSFYSWEVRYTRQEMEDLIRKRVEVGRLADVAVTRRGVSGRVIQVKITGSRGTFFLNGFKIRTALGVRENLFTIERQVDPGGGIRAFTFSGKGWGHGVGLCQVGAYGMALRGESFDRILKHYYPGIELIRAY
jgi:peptidoglycan hydrolase-like amidase